MSEAEALNLENSIRFEQERKETLRLELEKTKLKNADNNNRRDFILWTLVAISVTVVVLSFVFWAIQATQQNNIKSRQFNTVCMKNGGVVIEGGNGNVCVKTGVSVDHD